MDTNGPVPVGDGRTSAGGPQPDQRGNGADSGVHGSTGRTQQPETAGNESDRLSVLIVEDAPDDARRMREVIAREEGMPVRVDWVMRLADALATLQRDPSDIVLLDLSLPDGRGTTVFHQVQRAAPEAVIIVLEADGEDDGARDAVTAGAYDRLDKHYVDPYWLPRALRYIAAYKRSERDLRASETHRQTLSDAAFEQAALAEITLDSIGDAVLATDLDGSVTFINRVAEGLTGWARGEAQGRPLLEVFRIVDRASQRPAANPARLAIDQDRTVGLASDCMLIRRDGTQQGIEDSAAPIHSRSGKVVGAVIVFRDVNHSLERREEIAYLAQHDPLTGLANRSLLTELLNKNVNLACRHRRRLAVLFADLNNFKQYNDRYGHGFGDQLLRMAAQRLTESARATDTVSRRGGDEFVVLLPEIDNREMAARIAQRLLERCAEPYYVGGWECVVTMSIGISVFPDDADTAEAMLHNADVAMYQAKTDGTNRYCFYDRSSCQAADLS